MAINGTLVERVVTRCPRKMHYCEVKADTLKFISTEKPFDIPIKKAREMINMTADEVVYAWDAWAH